MAVKVDVKAEKTRETNQDKEQREDLLRAWNEGYATASRFWEDSYSKLYKPWVESTGKMLEKSSQIARDATPAEYKQFFDDWTKMYRESFGNWPSAESNREALNKLLAGAEKSRKVFKSWADELEEDTRKTSAILQKPLEEGKYKEMFEMWTNSYNRMMDEMMSLPLAASMSEVYESTTGLPDLYSKTFAQGFRLWRDSYTRLYGPLIDAMHTLETRADDISKGGPGPESYKEFFNLWTETFKNVYEHYFQSAQPANTAVDNFSKAADLYLNTFKSWIEALDRMTEKTKELTQQVTDPAAQKEFYDAWLKMYDKAFTNFFENMPAMGPIKEMMAPVKLVARMYSETLDNMAKSWASRS